ncbi:MAG: hypothetical protein AAFN93_13275, partial [Bacteroidota bacterium]
LLGMGIRKVSPEDFLHQNYEEPVFTHSATTGQRNFDLGKLNFFKFRPHFGQIEAFMCRFQIKIALTGGGRVSKGAIEILLGMGIRKVSPEDFLHQNYEEPVFTQLNSRDYHVAKDGSPFNRSTFYSSPDKYESTFLSFAKVTDILISGGFWDPRAPVLFTTKDSTRPDFNIRVIADITCDIEGSIPSTKKPSTIDDPVYDYNPSEDSIEPPFADEANLSVMAVDNLPCELPRDASKDFGRELIDNVIPHLLGGDEEQMILRATITKDGKLTNKYKYLTEYVSSE